MKVSESPEIGGRWSEYGTMNVEDWEVVWAHLDGDYQGSCTFIARSPDGMYVESYWNWGSCSGCDGYEDLAYGGYDYETGEYNKAGQDEIERIFLTENREYFDFESLKGSLALLVEHEPEYTYYWDTRGAKIEALRAEVARVEG